MILAVVVMVAAAVLAWLSVADRMSPLAMYVVEAEGIIGVPLWIPLAVVGAGLLWRASRTRQAVPTQRRETQESQRHRSPEPGRSPRASAVPGPDATEGEGWRAVIDTRALRLPVGPQGKMRIDEVPEVPYTLVMTDVTPQQAKNRLALFAELLSGMPTPPVARVRLESAPDVGAPIHKLFTAELARFFAADTFHVIRRSDGADVCFAKPDPRWGRDAAG